jgi:hypothetical protein
MSYAKQTLDTYPTPTIDASVLAAAIDAMNDCARLASPTPTLT